MKHLPAHVTLLMATLAPTASLAEIDSGGGRTAVGTMINHSSIGAPVATGNVSVGVNQLCSGLIQVLFSAATKPDANGNGLPDSWENQYFAGHTVDPQADSDSDGTTNLMEYLAGTDPTNWGSSFRPAGAYATGTYTIPIQTITGRTYKVWVSLNMTDWFSKETYVGDGTQKVFSFDETAIPPGPLHSTVHPSQYFFRVEVILP
jgi:hypothetical protein